MTDVVEAAWTPDELVPAGIAAVSAAGSSHAGRVRDHNEDAMLVGPPVFVVADGMGGHAAGDVASGLVIEAFSPLCGVDAITVGDIERALATCRRSIAGLAADADTAPGSTVVVAALVFEGPTAYWLIGNVGDSRAYLLGSHGLERVSHDHSVVQELLDAGRIDEVEARRHPERHVITRAIGAVDHSPPEYALVPVVAGTRLLLCSDGLTDELDDEQIREIVADGGSVRAAVARLIAAAVDAGGHDNVTAVLIDVVGDRSATVSDDTLSQPFTLDLMVDTLPGARRRS